MSIEEQFRLPAYPRHMLVEEVGVLRARVAELEALCKEAAPAVYAYEIADDATDNAVEYKMWETWDDELDPGWPLEWKRRYREAVNHGNNADGD